MVPGLSIQGKPAVALLGLGSNQGDREARLREALERLQARGAVHVAAVSSLWESAPLDAAGGDFLNAVARVETLRGPAELLVETKSAEHAAGRVGSGRDARPLDIDLLYYDDRVLREPGLSVPHPRRLDRAFVLAPLAEVCGDAVDPETGRTVAVEAANRLPGARPDVRRVKGPEWWTGRR